MLTALADHIWFCYLAYGIGVGVGGACCYLPTLAIIGGWFVRHRNTALGIAAAGTGCGTMVLPPLAAALIQCYGWRGTNIIFGLAAGVVLLGCAIAVKSPPIARSTSRPEVRSGVPFAHVNSFCSTSRGCWRRPRCSCRLCFCRRSPAIMAPVRSQPRLSYP